MVTFTVPTAYLLKCGVSFAPRLQSRLSGSEPQACLMWSAVIVGTDNRLYVA